MFVYYYQSFQTDIWKVRERRRNLVICSCVTVALFLVYLYARESYLSKRLLLARSKNQQDFFSNELFDVNKVENDKDPFSHHDFLSRNLAHLVSFTKFASSPKKLQTNNTFSYSDSQLSGNFTYLLDDLIATVNVNNFFFYQWGCKEVKFAQIQDLLHETKHQSTYQAVYDGYKVAIEVVKVDVDELISAKCGSSDSDHTQQNLDRCFLMKYRRILQEAVMLNQFNHPAVARILGICVQRINPGDKLDNKIASSSGVVLIKEAGIPLNMEHMKMQSWEQRVKACYSLTSLTKFLSTLPLGSISLNNWDPENFILSSKTNDIKLNSFSRFPLVTEPSCVTASNCLVEETKCGIKCINGECKGFNEQKNLMIISRIYLLPLLQFGVPSQFTKGVTDLLRGLKKQKYTSAELLKELEKFLPKNEGVGKSFDGDLSKHEVSNNNPAVLSVKRLPDGSQVDSWEQHESRVSINEVNPGKIVAGDSQPIKDVDLAQKPKEDIPIEGFEKIENADFPGRYDYYCPYSKAEWGCVMSLQSPEEAVRHCLKDVKCKSFVTIPHLRKEGWIIAILKSDNSKPVDHAGTTVYVRPASDALPEPEKVTQKVVVNEKKEECLSDIEMTQYYVREAREAVLMKTCGWKGMKDKDWVNLVAESKIEDASTFKPARGKLANGGQMNIHVKQNGNVIPALFLAKRGPEEFDVSQLAVYQLDRMLGLYKTVPAIERMLSASELAEAGFPVDIGGNQFDKFRQLKLLDNSLRGVIVPTIPERVTTVHYISVPKLSGLTNAVTPFSKKQWDDMEYLLLGFLAAIPVPSKGHQSIQGHLMHIKTDDAFQNDNNDYLSYLYNCQFPEHVISTLRYASSNHCEVKDQFHTHLWSDESPMIGQLLDRNIARLLDLVDKCETKFGKQVVLYNSQNT
uniref:Uncharacterized protein LOC100184284 n=1 Tax=Phallusia mammillata TaxID=59560 RepID=A0A6F9DIS9_9ASCI|nr:uncharacterized protein LOC100184284 [Phallusia mammillata]